VTPAWSDLRQDVKLCRRCPLSESRSCAVPGEGPPDARILIVGDAPSDGDTRAAKPFTGKQGDKLDAWLSKAGLTRDEVFLTTLLKCQPPENKFPDYKEGGPADRCLPYLHAQLRLLNPFAVIVCGKNALQHLVLDGTARKARFIDEWAGMVLRRRDLLGEARIGVTFSPHHVQRKWNPMEEEKCVRVFRNIAAYSAARRQNEPAPQIDMVEIRPITPPTFQQRFRLFPEQPKPVQEPT